MKKQLMIALFLFLSIGIVFGQAGKTAKDKYLTPKIKKEVQIKNQKVQTVNDISPNAHHSSSSGQEKAAWDILYNFNTNVAGQQAVETDGNFIYTTDWQGAGAFHKYSMTGTFDSDFTITGANAIRDLAFDGTYFYGSGNTLNLFKMDFTAGTLVSTIPVTCSGITSIRHCAYDPTLDGGNGGFWIGAWAELGAVSMTGTQLVANIAGNSNCYGSAYDNWTDPANPRLLLFQQGGSGVEIHGFDINTQTFTGLVHDATDIPGFDAANGIGGGLASYEANGKFILLGNIQQDPNLIFAYELADTAPIDAPGPATNLVATPGALGVMTVDMAWTNPTLTVGGATLTELTSVSLYIDAVTTPLYTNSSPAIGGAENQTAIDLSAYSPGFHTFKIIGTNSAGDGTPATVTAWIGEDAPAAPTAATLVDAGSMLAQVSWVAPTTGFHGGYLSGTGITYDVTRYPGGVLVSDDQPGLTFQETLTNVGNYYYTITASNAIGVGGTATTNSVIFGNFFIYEDFEGTFPSTGWVTNSNVGIWAQAPGTVHPAGVAPHGGNSLAYFNSWTCAAGSTADLITPSVDLSSVIGELNIWVYHEPGYSTSDDNIQIKMSTDNGTTWTNLGAPISRYAATAEWTLHQFYINNGTATTMFNFFATSEYGNDIHIDDITLVEAPSCIAPSALYVTNVGDVSVDLGWFENGTATAWSVEVGPIGFTQGTGTMYASITSNPLNITGLTASSQYDFYVQADCGGGDVSAWTGPYTFTTAPCAVASQCNFDFQFIDDFGDGWNGASVTVTQNGAVTGTYTLANGSAGNSTVSLCDGANVELTFTSGAYDSECGFTLVDPFGITITSFAVGSAPAGGSTFFTFTGSCTPPSCPRPTALGASNFTLNSADLDWTAGGSETAWNVEYGPVGFTQGTGTTVPATANPFTLNGLTAGTTYDYYVQADCGGGDLSLWAGPFTFNTMCNIINTYPWTDGFENGIACYTITGLPGVETWFLGTTSPLTGTYSAEINYDPVPSNQDEWLISQVFDLTPLTDPQITFNWNMSYNWGVSPNDNYDMFLKATTDGGTTWTTLWTEPAVFTDWTYYDTTISLSSFMSATTFQFAFHYFGNDGAAFYLDDITIDNITNINTVKEKANVYVYPNPVNNTLFIANAKDPIVNIYNTLGELVLTDDNSKVDVSSLSQGIYVVKIIESNNTTTSQISIVK